MAVMYPTPLKFGDKETAQARTMSAGAAATVLPLNSIGEKPKYVRVCAEIAGMFAFGQASMGVADATFGTWVAVGEAIIVDVTGHTHMRNDGTGTFVVTALENDGGIA